MHILNDGGGDWIFIFHLFNYTASKKLINRGLGLKFFDVNSGWNYTPT